MNRLYSIGCVILLILMFACNIEQKKITIGYIQITQDAVLDAAKAGVFRALADSGFIDGKTVKVMDTNAAGACDSRSLDSRF